MGKEIIKVPNEQEQNAIKILAKHWFKRTGKEIDFTILNHLDYVVKAMQEYSDQQNKQILDNITKLKRDNIALESVNKQFTEHIDIKNNEIERLKIVICKKYDSLIVVKNNEIAKLQSELKDCTDNYNHYVDKCFKLEFELKTADSVNENLSKQVEWISVEDRLPLANESGAWHGKRSDVYLGKYKDDTYCLFRIYEGFLDGSDFIEYYDENDNSINAPVYYKSIT